MVKTIHFRPESIRIDVALMRLEQPIPYTIANPFALHSGRVSGTEISLASYGRGRSEAITRERSCRILNRRLGLIIFDCDITFGSSGFGNTCKERSSLANPVGRFRRGRLRRQKSGFWHGVVQSCGRSEGHIATRCTSAKSFNSQAPGWNWQVYLGREIYQLRRVLNSAVPLPIWDLPGRHNRGSETTNARPFGGHKL